jgi:hypothetical protein
MISKKSLPVMRYRVHKSKNCFSIFSETVKDSHEIFMDDRSLNWGVKLGIEHIDRHIWSSLEVKKEIELFRNNNGDVTIKSKPIPHYYVCFQVSKIINPTGS